jgi:small subunit ribosomal protein S4
VSRGRRRLEVNEDDDMRRIRKKFKKPKVPWNKNKIKEDRVLLKEYGLRRKKEMLKARQMLRDYRKKAGQLIAIQDKEKEKVLIEKMVRLGFLPSKESTLDDVLALTINDVLNRRLQTIVLRRGIAKTPLQARQMIVHGHVSVAGKKTKFPSYIVAVEEEKKIAIYKEARKPKAEKPKPEPVKEESE